MADEPIEAQTPDATLPTDVPDADFDSAVDDVQTAAPTPGPAAPRPGPGSPPADKGDGKVAGKAQEGASDGKGAAKGADEGAAAQDEDEADGDGADKGKGAKEADAADADKDKGKDKDKDKDKAPSAAERADARAKEMAEEQARDRLEREEQERAREREEQERKRSEQGSSLAAFRQRILSAADKAGFKLKVGSDDGKGEVELSLTEYAERYPALMDAQLFVQQALVQEQVAPLHETIARMAAEWRIQRLASVLARPDMGGHADAADIIFSDGFQAWLAKDASAGIRACAASASAADNRIALEAYKDAQKIAYGSAAEGGGEADGDGDGKGKGKAAASSGARDKRETVLRATLRSRGAGAPPASQGMAGEEDKAFESAADEFEQGRRRR